MTEHKSVWAAFAAAQAEFKAPAQSGVNPHFKSRYSTLGDIFAATFPALHKHGLCFTQSLHAAEDAADVLLKTSVTSAETGEVLHSSIMVPIDSNPQAFGSRLSYMKRYSAAALLGVVDGMDDDGEEAEKQPVTAQKHPVRSSGPTTPQNGAQKPATQATDDWKHGLSPDECDLIESWEDGIQAQDWAVERKYCENKHEAKNSMRKIITEQFGNAFNAANMRSVLAAFYRRQMEKAQERQTEQ